MDDWNKKTKYNLTVSYQDGTEENMGGFNDEMSAIDLAQALAVHGATIYVKNRLGYLIGSAIGSKFTWEQGSELMEMPFWSCVVCGERPCECVRIENYKPIQYFTTEPRHKDEKGNEYIGLVVDLPVKMIDSKCCGKPPCYYPPKNKPADPRPSWDAYFIKLAQDVSLRSEDVFIKHGCIIVDRKTNHILGSGYNALFRGADKGKINIHDREARRVYYIHAEDNAIMNCTKNPLDLQDGAKAYITGRSCNSCLQHLINFGVVEIIELAQMGSITDSPEEEKIRENILNMAGGRILIKKIPTQK